MRKLSLPWFIPALGLTVALSIILAGCGSDSAPTGPAAGSGVETGTLALGLRLDNGESAKSESISPLPEGMVDLFLTFDSVIAWRAVGTFDSLGMTGEDCDSSGAGMGRPHGMGEMEPVELLIEPVTVGVGDLGETLTALLGESALPEGFYPRLELGLSGAWLVTDADSVINVALPVRGDSLLRVISPFDVVNGETTALVLVVDVERSLYEMPRGSGEYVLRPVIRGEVVPHGEMTGWHPHHDGDDDHGMMGDDDDGMGYDGDDDHGMMGDDDDGSHGMGGGMGNGR